MRSSLIFSCFACVLLGGLGILTPGKCEPKNHPSSEFISTFLKTLSLNLEIHSSRDSIVGLVAQVRHEVLEDLDLLAKTFTAESAQHENNIYQLGMEVQAKKDLISKYKEGYKMAEQRQKEITEQISNLTARKNQVDDRRNRYIATRHNEVAEFVYREREMNTALTFIYQQTSSLLNRLENGEKELRALTPEVAKRFNHYLDGQLKMMTYNPSLRKPLHLIWVNYVAEVLNDQSRNPAIAIAVIHRVIDEIEKIKRGEKAADELRRQNTEKVSRHYDELVQQLEEDLSEIRVENEKLGEQITFFQAQIEDEEIIAGKERQKTKLEDELHRRQTQYETAKQQRYPQKITPYSVMLKLQLDKPISN